MLCLPVLKALGKQPEKELLTSWNMQWLIWSLFSLILLVGISVAWMVFLELNFPNSFKESFKKENKKEHVAVYLMVLVVIVLMQGWSSTFFIAICAWS